jgi:penicillin-binding protein-related factor A (putative recombinase)
LLLTPRKKNEKQDKDKIGISFFIAGRSSSSKLYDLQPSRLIAYYNPKSQQFLQTRGEGAG